MYSNVAQQWTSPKARCPGSCCPPGPVPLLPHLPLPASLPDRVAVVNRWLVIGLFQDAASQTADLTVPCRPQLPLPISLVTTSSRVLHSSVPRTGKLQSMGTRGQMSPQHVHFFEAFCAQSKHTNPQVNPSMAPRCPQGQVPASPASSRNL